MSTSIRADQGKFLDEDRPISKSILVVDDDVSLRELFRNVLVNEGYEVFVAGSGSEALERFSSHQIDLLLTDISMPVMDGLSLAKIVSLRYPTVQILVCSAQVTDSDNMKYIRDHDWGFLHKPFRCLELTDSVRQRVELNGAEKRIRRILK